MDQNGRVASFGYYPVDKVFFQIKHFARGTRHWLKKKIYDDKMPRD